MMLLVGGRGCRHCRSPFATNDTRPHHAYCSPRCRKDAEKALRRDLRLVRCAYAHCFETFKQRHALQRYHSKRCRDLEGERLRVLRGRRRKVAA